MKAKTPKKSQDQIDAERAAKKKQLDEKIESEKKASRVRIRTRSRVGLPGSIGGNL